MEVEEDPREKQFRVGKEDLRALVNDRKQKHGSAKTQKDKKLDRGPSFGSWLEKKPQENFKVEVTVVDGNDSGRNRTERIVKNIEEEREISIEVEDGQGAEEWLKQSPEYASNNGTRVRVQGRNVGINSKPVEASETQKASVWDRLSSGQRFQDPTADQFVFGSREGGRMDDESERTKPKSKLDSVCSLNSPLKFLGELP